MVYTAADMILKFLNKDDCNVSNSSCTTEMFYFLWSRTWTCNELYTAASSIIDIQIRLSSWELHGKLGQA